MTGDRYAFRQRFNRWKQGERYWSIIGRPLPHYADGKDAKSSFVQQLETQPSILEQVAQYNRESKDTKTTENKYQFYLDKHKPLQQRIREQKTANQRERNIAKHYLAAGPNIANLANAAYHWYNSVPFLGGEPEDGSEMITGVAPAELINDFQKLVRTVKVAREIENAIQKGIQSVDKVKDGAGYYRKLGQGLLNKILNSGGSILHTSGEKTLTLKKGKPRSGDYYIKIDKNSVPVAEEKPRKPYSMFNRKPTSARIGADKGYSPNINDPEVRLFARTGNGKYKEIKDPLNTPELRIQPLDRKIDKGYVNEKQRGSEIRLDEHSILTNDRRTTMSSSDYIMDPYMFRGAIDRGSKEVWIPNDIGHSKFIKIPQKRSAYLENIYKDSPSVREMFRDEVFVPANKILSRSKGWVMSTKKALEIPRKNNKDLDLIREYIDGDDFNISPIFDTNIMQHAMLDYYKNVYGIDVTGLDRIERAKFMLALKNRSKGELLFHSTNVPFTRWNPSKIGSNTGNEGFFGRGLYTTDEPTTDYGEFQIPLMISNPTKQIIIERTPGVRRFTSPMLDVDDALLLATLPTWHFLRGGRYVPDERYSIYPGMPFGGKPDVWNQWLKDNHIDLVRAADSSKGSGIYAETLIPENTSATVSPFFKSLTELPLKK